MNKAISFFLSLSLLCTGCTLYQSPDRAYFNSNATLGAPASGITAQDCHLALDPNELATDGLDLSQTTSATNRVATVSTTELFAAALSPSGRSAVICEITEKPDLSDADSASRLQVLTEVAVDEANAAF